MYRVFVAIVRRRCNPPADAIRCPLKYGGIECPRRARKQPGMCLAQHQRRHLPPSSPSSRRCWPRYRSTTPQISTTPRADFSVPSRTRRSRRRRAGWSGAWSPTASCPSEEAPPTVNPSLWRQSRLNMQHGLFEVVPGVYQVRGLDIANMTLIEGDTGVIVVDTLTSIEGARAALELYFSTVASSPVAAVIFTHTHTDHWGGARGVLDDGYARGRTGADHRAESVHGARGLREHHRRPRDAASCAISVRSAAGQGRARPGRLRTRQVDGGGLGGAVAPDRPDHGDRRHSVPSTASNSNSRWRRTARRRRRCISSSRATSS